MDTDPTATVRITRQGDVLVDGHRVGHVERQLRQRQGARGPRYDVVWLATDRAGQDLGTEWSRRLAVAAVVLMARRG